MKIKISQVQNEKERKEWGDVFSEVTSAILVGK